MTRRRGTRRAAVRTLSASVERSLRFLVGSLVLAAGLVAGAVAASEVLATGAPGSRGTLDDQRLALVVGAALCLVLAGLRCLDGHLGGREVLLGATSLAVVVAAPHAGIDLPAPLHQPVLPLGATLLMVVAVRRQRTSTSVLLVLAITAVHLGALRILDGPIALREGAERALPTAGALLGLLSLLAEMRRSLQRADHAIAARRSVEAEGMSAAEVEATSFLHDDLIPTLLAVAATGAADEGTREVAARVLERIEEPRPVGGGDLVADLRAAAAREGLAAEVVVRGRRRSLPAPVQDAVLGAATEALRNVTRHSGTDRVRVEVAGRRGRIHVSVEDDGVGFDARQGVGLRVAVLGRMEAVGGQARVSSTPGAGTRVDLTWQRDRLARVLGRAPEHERLVRVALADPAGVALRSCLALGAGLLLAGGIHTLDAPVPATSWLGAAAISALVVAIVVTLRAGPVHAALVGLSAVVPAGVVAAALDASGDPHRLDLGAWVIGFGALPALALAWVLTARGAFLVVAPVTAAVLAHVAVDLGEEGATSSLLLALVPPALLAPALIVVAVCRGAGSEVLATGKRTRPDRAAAIAALLGPLALELRAVLAAAANGTLGPVATADAAVLARAVRDCLYLPGRQHVDLRSQLTVLRRLGARVEITFTERPEASATLASALGALRVVEASQITVSGTIDAVTVVVVPGVTGAVEAEVERRLPIPWSGDYDPDAIVLGGPADLATVIRRGGRQHAPG